MLILKRVKNPLDFLKFIPVWNSATLLIMKSYNISKSRINH